MLIDFGDGDGVDFATVFVNDFFAGADLVAVVCAAEADVGNTVGANIPAMISIVASDETLRSLTFFDILILLHLFHYIARRTL